MGVEFTDATNASGDSTAYNTDYLGLLSSADLLTEAQIKSILRGIENRMVYLMAGGGPGSIMPYEEMNNETGFKVDPTAGMKELREMHLHFRQMLDDPNFISPFMGSTVWDNPHL